MSYKMRKIAQAMPNIEIIHRSFALAWEKEDLLSMFGSFEHAKREIMAHWRQANETDPLRRFNIEGMQAASFDFPSSKNALLAAKAAGILGGQQAYWDLFDALQKAMFVDSRDISSPEEISLCAKSANLDFEGWQRQLDHPQTEAEVKKDLALAQTLGIHSVPTLVINGRQKLSGSLPIEELGKSLEKLDA